MSSNIATSDSPAGAGSSPPPSFGFSAARAAVWSQTQKTHKNISGIRAIVYAGGVHLTALIHREHLSQFLKRHRRCGDEYEVVTSIGKLYVKPHGCADWRAEVRMPIDLAQEITDEGWIKGFDLACDSVWSKLNEKILPTCATGGSTEETKS